MNAALDQAYAERRALLERALARFAEVLERDPAQDDVVVDAGIQRFEFSIELFWRVVQAALQRLPPVTAP